MRLNSICQKCGLKFTTYKLKTKLRDPIAYTGNFKPVKCDKKGCDGIVHSLQEEEIKGVNIGAWSAQNLEYAKKQTR